MAYEGAIGIDLGTTYSCVGVWQNERVEIIVNDQGNRTTPSCVAFYNGDVLVGDAAKNLAARGVSGVVYDAKRLIGRRFSDSSVQDDARGWPFSIQPCDGDRICVCIDHNGMPLRLQPEQISAKILEYLKGCAESYLGKPVKKAVVTVPAYFNDSQRQATKDAGTIAGLEVLRVINEPTAAALCYGFGASSSNADAPLNAIVFDFGGGTFDVSVVSIDGGSVAVRSTAGDTHLGGQDIDAILLAHVAADLQSRHGVDCATKPRLLARLRARCEQAKCALSHATSDELAVDGVLPGGDEYAMLLTRARLEELCAPIFARCMSVVHRALRDAGVAAAEVDEVILVGGSSRVPRLRETLRAAFPASRMRDSVHPDEAVAIGAAVQASILSTAPEQQSARTADIVLMDVVPLSIGVEVDDGRFDPVIRRNTTIPYRATKEYSTVEDYQREVEVQVFEGERPLTRQNHKLGAFSLDGITHALRGEPTIVVTFDMDANGMLTITASETLGQAKKSLVVANSERLSEAEVQEMIATAERLRGGDLAAQKLRDALATLETVLSAVPMPHSSRLQKRVAFLEHGREWVEQHLPKYENPKEAEEKINKIMKLVRKAMTAVRREAGAGDGEDMVRKRQRSKSSSDSDAD